MPSVASSVSPSVLRRLRSTEAPPPVPAAAPPCGSSSSSMLPTSAATVDFTVLSSCAFPESVSSRFLSIRLSEAASVPSLPVGAGSRLLSSARSPVHRPAPIRPAFPPQPRSVRTTATTPMISTAPPAGTAMVIQSVLLLLCLHTFFFLSFPPLLSLLLSSYSAEKETATPFYYHMQPGINPAR